LEQRSAGTFSTQLVSPIAVFSYYFLCFKRFLLSHLSVNVSLIFSSRSSNQLFFISLKVENSGWTVGFDPVINIFQIDIKSIDEKWAISAIGYERAKMLNDFMEGQLLTVFWSNELLFD
jgi:hypothetical protein